MRIKYTWYFINDLTNAIGKTKWERDYPIKCHMKRLNTSLCVLIIVIPKNNYLQKAGIYYLNLQTNRVISKQKTICIKTPRNFIKNHRQKKEKY